MKFSTKFIAATKEYSTFEKQIPAPMFRRELELPKLERASLTICGLGFYCLYVNGHDITRGHLSPYISNPDQFLYFDEYDLIPYLNEGSNVIGVILGNGLQNCYGGQVWDFEKAKFRSAPKLALTFEGDGEDGHIEFDATEGFVCSESPIILDDLRIGEFYDARLEQDGWMLSDFDASAWREPITAEAPRGVCKLCDIDPIVATKELSPIKIKKGGIAKHFNGIQSNMSPLGEKMMYEYTEDNTNEKGYIYDFGVNSAGLCRLHIKNAKPGQRIIIQFGEKLVVGDDGEEGLDLRTMTFLPKRFDHREMYICRGGDEEYIPHFTYFGFRYALVTGIDEAQVTPDLLTYVVMNTALQTRAEFSCSDEMANKLWDAVKTADLANFYHFPTDCPHREKNGWTGDAQLSAEQMIMLLTPERNWREWMNSIRASMREDGMLPGIVPTSGWGYDWGNGPAWDIVLVALPYYAWLYRGNTELARENATAILRYINYITARRDERGLVHVGLGDWCPAARMHPAAPLEFTDTVVCIDFCRKASKLFEVLGMKAQKQFADEVHGELLFSARKYLINKDTKTALGRCQTTQAMAIYYDVFEEAEKPEAFKRLMELIDKNGESFDCGILGLRVIFHVLSAYGRTDLAYKMITKRDFPSYGYMIEHDSTTLWESFKLDSDSPDSRNHHFFGDIISWFMKNLVGININPYEDNPREVRFAPKFIDALDHAEGEYDSVCGKVSAHWERDGEDILYSYKVPEGMYAELVVECGYKTDMGTTWSRLYGEGSVRIILDTKRDIMTIKY